MPVARNAPVVVTDPCLLLVQAQQALSDLMLGRAASVIETPQLGRVEFAKTDIAALQRYIDELAGQCAAQQSGVTPTGTILLRRPLSVESRP